MKCPKCWCHHSHTRQHLAFVFFKWTIPASFFFYFHYFRRFLPNTSNLKLIIEGSGCGSVGRAVASESRRPRFESRHRQKFKLNILTVKFFKLSSLLILKKQSKDGVLRIQTQFFRMVDTDGYTTPRGVAVN